MSNDAWHREAHQSARLWWWASPRSIAALDSTTIIYDLTGKNDNGHLMHQTIRKDGIGLELGDAKD